MADLTSDDKYILWLSRIEGLGGRKILSLLDYFDNISDIFEASPDDFKNIGELSERNVANILSKRDKRLIDVYVQELNDAGADLITIYNPLYPSLLKEIHDPPACFYMLGELPGDGIPKISVIGSRRCSEYGLTVSRKLGRELAERGAVVVSGMAKGIDSSAHRGALDGGGKTVAVLGCGVDICYPAENRILREQIIHGGCVISEYPMGAKPHPSNFPMRNRIISGLSLATVVVEAAEKSGTLITAGQALDQGREVFAVPGNVTSKLSRGTNALIKQGAALVENYADVFNLLNIPCEEAVVTTHESVQLKPEEKVVYDHIGQEPVNAADIMLKSGGQAQTVQYILTMLEIYGLIRKLPGARYIRA